MEKHLVAVPEGCFHQGETAEMLAETDGCSARLFSDKSFFFFFY